MARDVMILMRAASITRAIGRGGPWEPRLLWALKWQWSLVFTPYVLFSNDGRLIYYIPVEAPYKLMQHFREIYSQLLFRPKMHLSY